MAGFDKMKGCLVFLLFPGFLLVSCRDAIDIPEEVKAELSQLTEVPDFTYEVKPILSDRCFACHGPDQKNQKAGLRLDIAESAYHKNADSDLKAIVPGKPGKSELVYRILSADADVMMPTPDSHLSLTPKEKAILIKWIEGGAVYKPHWAFTKINKPRLPAVKNTAWTRNGIDHFVLERLEKRKLAPAEEADKTTLFRRVSMDLTGLPPRPEDVIAFMKDTSANAYEAVVDRLLCSPHYGEHMAVSWLDAARYADSHGYQDDGMRNAWPYRDWVIRAFNENLPFDKFVTWQLAGDLLPNATKEQLLATAFNRMHQQTQENGIIEEEYRTAYVADRTDTFGKTFLGLTVECARCHDHKYDPVSHKDYYSLFAFFNNINETGHSPYNGEPSPSITLPSPEAELELERIRLALKKGFEQMDSLSGNPGSDYQNWLQASFKEPSSVNVPEKTGLIGHFTFDEPEGGEFQNLVNPSHKAVSEGDDSLSVPASRIGKFGKSRFMYGENSIRFGDKFAFFERDQPFSIGIWLKIHDNSLNGSVIHKSNGALNGFRGWNIFRLADGRLKVIMSNVWPENAIEIHTVEPFPVNEWAHLCLTYDGCSKADGLKLFVNGKRAEVVVHNDQLSQSILYGKNKTNWTVDQLRIGRLYNDRTKDFEVDEMKLYERALSAVEVLRQFTGNDVLSVLLQKKKETRSAAEEKLIREYYLSHFNLDFRRSQEQVRALINRETAIRNSQIDVMVMKERKFPRKTFILDRGVYDAPAAAVTPDTPESLFRFPEGSERNRLGLAQWLLNEENPLFARVMVNRFWQSCLGRGLVVSGDDFGNQGDLPTHPELLDWLASVFRESGWDVKKFQKMIVMSATYRQSSKTTIEMREADPENSLYARGASFRLSAEQIRDNALASSGLLMRAVGGRSVYPYQPAGIWEALATRNEVTYRQQHGDSLYRRSLYTVWKRSAPPPMMLNFDASERHFCITRRQNTSTPLQALVTLNDPQFVEASRVLAQEMIRRNQNPDERISYAFLALAGRLPAENEREMLRELYDAELSDFRRHPSRAKELLSVGEYPVDGASDPIDLAATTIVASTIMNFDEFLIKR